MRLVNSAMPRPTLFTALRISATNNSFTGVWLSSRATQRGMESAPRCVTAIVPRAGSMPVVRAVGRIGLVGQRARSTAAQIDRGPSILVGCAQARAACPSNLEDTIEPCPSNSLTPVAAFESELTASAVEAVRTLIEMAATTESPLRCWRISLGCSHVVEVRQHASLHAPEVLRLVCPRCGTRQLALTVVPVDPVSERAALVLRTRLELRRALEEFSRAQRRLARARRRVEQTRSTLLALVQDDVHAVSGGASTGKQIYPVDDLAEQGLARGVVQGRPGGSESLVC